jgi:hypothetical protein
MMNYELWMMDKYYTLHLYTFTPNSDVHKKRPQENLEPLLSLCLYTFAKATVHRCVMSYFINTTFWECITSPATMRTT